MDIRADEKKITDLLLAAKFDYNECIKALLEGADPGITDRNEIMIRMRRLDYYKNCYKQKLIRETTEGLWYISKKLLEVEESVITAEDNEIFRSLYHENSFGQTPTDIVIQMFLSLTTNSFGLNQLYHNQHIHNQQRAAKSFNLMVPKYLPRNQGNPLAVRVNVKFDAV
ncbi:hypothetical protein RhiirC2_790797 [Rhizophagus irregularis]|uniref:Uncharacterized protein n=1 Tax=Rhizophagus irregularis TaxID=588596 RepID=A0A2N1MKI5_9GLOM|nr:hypothetical protein RhiirC2_790797 [Rhizophagus irregularis]